jgi:methionyl-tRNA synthetase
LTYGYQCEECEEAVWPATTRAELNWLRNREHVVREVAPHLQSGVDTWMVEALEFLDRHRGHSVLIAERPNRR